MVLPGQEVFQIRYLYKCYISSRLTRIYNCFKAFCGLGIAADRTCIQTNGSFQGELSVENYLRCSNKWDNCHGGEAFSALVYWAKKGENIFHEFLFNL